MNIDRTPTVDEMAMWLADTSVPLAHRVLWRLLDESDVRIGELLAMEVPVVALADRTLHIVDSQEGPKDVSVTEEAATGLGELIGTRQHGPVFIEPDGTRLTRTSTAETFRTLTGMSLHAIRHGRLDRWRRGRHDSGMLAAPHHTLTGSN
ncbi:hypothetical protein ACX9I7_01025 [Streptomyces sp. L500]